VTDSEECYLAVSHTRTHVRDDHARGSVEAASCGNVRSLRRKRAKQGVALARWADQTKQSFDQSVNYKSRSS